MFKGLISFFILCTIVSFFSILNDFPDEINIVQGQKQKLISNVLFNLRFEPNQESLEVKNFSFFSPYAFLDAKTTGSIRGKVKLFGLLPIKNFTLNVIPNTMVVPSGESIGVKIESKGIIVVGLSSITDFNGKKICPAADAGFVIGDKILEINGLTVEKEEDIVEMINNNNSKGQKYKVTVERNKKRIDLTIQPVQSIEDKLYKMGLWVRNNIAGVGTMTFYEPTSGQFAALGHGITDMDSGVLIDIDKGKILKSKVISIQKAKKSTPGEIIGIFSDNNGIYGIIEKNTPYGIYGVLEQSKVDKNRKLIPIGLGSHVREGPAKIITTIEDNKIEEFDIEIQKVFRQNNADSKSMIIKITDKRLIERTGGIVQGMSGSPIIQNGRLIGSVTHVLVNDPTRGYGIFVEWMLNEIKINSSNEYRSVIGQ